MKCKQTLDWKFCTWIYFLVWLEIWYLKADFLLSIFSYSWKCWKCKNRLLIQLFYDLKIVPQEPESSPCNPSPCGLNAECRERNNAGACYCLPGFEGNPYDREGGCRRECELNEDCSDRLSCVKYKCINPCIGTCGRLALCTVSRHIPTCTCPVGLTGDPFYECREIPTQPPSRNLPCSPSPCGPNSNCRDNAGQSVCSCAPGYIGTPPECRPECVVSSECPSDKACINNKCADPCPHSCGIGSVCHASNHNPICACPTGYTGDPFTQCTVIRKFTL